MQFQKALENKNWSARWLFVHVLTWMVTMVPISLLLHILHTDTYIGLLPFIGAALHFIIEFVCSRIRQRIPKGLVTPRRDMMIWVEHTLLNIILIITTTLLLHLKFI